MKKVPGLTAQENQSGSEVDIENQMAWSSGSALMKIQAADSSCERDFMRTDLAIGILFQHPGSRVTWDLDGKRVLSKAWSPTELSHDLVVLPPGCTFQERCDFAFDRCVAERPALSAFAPGRAKSCHLTGFDKGGKVSG